MGKKKSKKKSKSKKGSGPNSNSNSNNNDTNNTTPTAASTTETTTDDHAVPTNIVSEEEEETSDYVPENTVQDTPSEQGEIVEKKELETKDDAPTETSKTELPPSEKVVSSGKDDTPIAKDSTRRVPTDDQGTPYKQEKEEAMIVQDHPELNSHIGDDDDALFQDARSCETNDSIIDNDLASVESNEDANLQQQSEKTVALDTETSMGATNDSSNGEREEKETDAKADIPAESNDEPTLDVDTQPIEETTVEVIKIFEPNADNNEAALNAFDDAYVNKYDEGNEADSYNNSDDATQTTYVDELPLFHYSRIVSSGLPKGIPKNPNDTNIIRPPHERQSKCSEFAIVRVAREELASNVINVPSSISPTANDLATTSANSENDSTEMSGAAMRKRQQEQTLLLSSDLWFQPHSIVASGYGNGKITLTRLGVQSSASSSPSVVFATPNNADLGGIIADTSGHGKSTNKQNSYTTVLNIRDGNNNNNNPVSNEFSAIVDMSFDASGSVLGAIDGGGNCSIWEFKYSTSLQSKSLLFGDFLDNEPTANPTGFFTPASTPNPTRPMVSQPAPSTGGGMFSNFMSVLTGIPPADENVGGNNNNSSHGVPNIASAGSNETTNSSPAITASGSIGQPLQPPEALIPALTAEITLQTKNNYPAKWGAPTCMAIDPAYKIKRDKTIVVGFANGQLYLTKKGTFFQRRNDTILYQAGNTGGASYRGIECVVWRGPLVAFADVTGIKLIDSENLTRIAHINRPAGASPFLYPSIRDISPSLVFETCQHLLVGWGDCLMQIYVEEHEEDASSATPSMSQSAGGSETGSRDIRIRRTATCTMAWELDCVACDVVPLDSDRVVVLGLVSLTEDSEDDVDHSSPSHDLELQILSRGDGTISYSDSLPLIEGNRGAIESMLSARDFRLLSSFAMPRMTNADETKALRALKGANDMGFVGIDVSFDINQPLFAGTDSFAKKGIEFIDPHLEWNIKSIMYDEEIDGETNDFGTSNKDDSSVDSDDYECILRPIETIRTLPSQFEDPAATFALPPTMVVCTPSEAILSLTSTVDDAIEYSLDNHKCALALSRGIRHKRQLRRYNLDDLINFYLEAVLRIPRFTKGQEKTTTISLSLRRMQLAIKAMPVLLGDKIELWERWTKELENIPGSLFLLRKYLPVRDPILPSSIYIQMLEKMLSEVEVLSQSSRSRDSATIATHRQASKHFLDSLVAWGPTKVLKEFISFYKYNKQRRKGGKEVDDDIRSTEISLQRRYLQTAAGYLIFPVRDIEEQLQVSAPRYEVLNVDTEDSLFDISKAVAVMALRVPIVAQSEDFVEGETRASQSSAPNDHTCLEAMARLRMMQGEFDLALKCFLAIGACHATEPIEKFEEAAVRIVNGTSTAAEMSSSTIKDHSYEFVMNLIERNELNQFLFEKDFLQSTDSKLFMPIFALIRLVGLQCVGNFLIENCVAAGFTYNTSLSEMNAFSFSEEDSMDEPKGILRRGSLPIDKIAKLLENSPAILHWYLHVVFTKRPEFYIHFPTNAIPSRAVTTLHRRHFQLYVDFAGEARDSSKVLAGIEAYNVESKTTALLTFLKAALPLGGVMPVDARRVLEIERRKDVEDDDEDSSRRDAAIASSPIFALELAYIIETYSDETETEAMGILNLYLKGAKSLPLAVSYAQRQKKFSAILWDHLISYCLKEASDGTIYGELLEAAALKGADLSRLVERIPPGMVVEGLRPKLVAAVADYRMKLEIYEAAIAAGSEEKVALMREIGHRARRGLRHDLVDRKKSFAELIAEKVQSEERENPGSSGGTGGENDPSSANAQRMAKTRLRRDNKRLAYSIPRR